VKVGELVNFFTTFEPFRAGYEKRNPGIVLTVKESVNPESRGSAIVLWSDGSVTSEHSTYLVEAHDENR
jgi:hypothetical protein